MIVLNINGPINAGKSTCAKILNSRINNSLFIEGDDLLSDEERERLNLDFSGRTHLRLERLDKVLNEMISKQNHDVIIFTFPISEGNHKRWLNIVNGRAKLKVITLAPKLDHCLTNRGARELAEWELNRIKEMYSEGYHNPPEADFIIDNSRQTPEETVDKIISLIG